MVQFIRHENGLPGSPRPAGKSTTVPPLMLKVLWFSDNFEIKNMAAVVSEAWPAMSNFVATPWRRVNNSSANTHYRSQEQPELESLRSNFRKEAPNVCRDCSVKIYIYTYGPRKFLVSRFLSA